MADESGSNPPPEKGQLSTSPSRGTPHGRTPKQLSLLLAEDNLPDALLIREAIKREGLPVEVHIVPDGERAVDFIARAGQHPDLPLPHVLLLDLNLPKIDGFEVLRRIRANEKCKHIPVIVVTSSDSPEDRNTAAQLGASYFRKPTSYEEFLKIGAVLRRVLEESDLL